VPWEETLRAYADSGYVRAGLVVVAVLGILLRYMAVRRSRKNRQLRSHSDNVTMMRLEEGEDTKLQLAYKGRRIHNATISTIRLWNSGTEEIRRDDIPKTDPIRISLPETVEILEHNVLKETRDGNRVECSLRSPSLLEVSFEYLNPGDGAIIQLLHTGDLESKAELNGDIMGPGGEVVSESERRLYIHGLDGSKKYMLISQGAANAWSLAVWGVFGAMCLLAYWFQLWILTLVTGLLLVVLGVFSALPSRSQIPKELRSTEP
jgi:hypothetical protein